MHLISAFLFWGHLGCTPQDETDTATLEPVACQTLPEGDVSLPLDERPHNEDVEWWYWTGHLQDEDGRWYGFEQVFFSFRYAGMDAMMAHHAVTDVEAQHFDYVAFYGVDEKPAVLDQGFEFQMGSLTAEGANGVDVLHGELERTTLDLKLTSTKAPVLQHQTGYTEYPFGGYTYYYTRPRMSAEGTLVVDGESRAVTGSAWFDHQWGALIEATNVGWDWFALQLDDGREIMVFLLRPEDGLLVAGATVTDADCNSNEIHDVTVTPLGEWTSPATECTYPMGWDLQVGDEVFTLSPVMEDQEIGESYKTYWEGAATVDGAATGRAYVELTEYCD
ncbi:MAG: lipocalin family protein [Myxococcota bacterium]|nr:lipocalin family protein [Myxococcota bacterium]